jgi:phospholipid-translocating ATPase
MIGTIVLFNDSFVNIVSITFTALIFIELLNIFTEVTKIKFKMVVSIVLTIIVYVASIILFRNYFDVAYFDMKFLLKVMVITSCCWLPIHILKKIIEKCDPSEEAKVKKSWESLITKLLKHNILFFNSFP